MATKVVGGVTPGGGGRDSLPPLGDAQPRSRWARRLFWALVIGIVLMAACLPAAMAITQLTAESEGSVRAKIAEHISSGASTSDIYKYLDDMQIRYEKAGWTTGDTDLANAGYTGSVRSISAWIPRDGYQFHIYFVLDDTDHLRDIVVDRFFITL